MRQMAQLALLWLAGTVPASAIGMPALVDAAWLQANRESPGLVILDIQEPDRYRRFHVPGAVNAPYGLWRTSGKGEPRAMLPAAEKLESLIGGLGIDNETSVVIVAGGAGAGDLAAAARVFWTFQVLGHEQVAVLDGGLLAYAKAVKGASGLQSGSNRPQAKTFEARPRPEMVVGAEAVRTALEQGAELVDARSTGEYMGLYAGGEGERLGTLPGAKTLPFDWLSDQGSGQLRDLPSLKALYAALGIAEQGEQLHFCHSGNRASLTWFVSYALLGNRQAKLYDGSMMEWAPRPDLPMERKIKLCEAC